MTGSAKPSAQQPLAGVKIIELSTMITCAVAAMMLSAQGAEVIKVEPPDIGDPGRLIGTQKNGVSAFFHNCNRGKQSLAIDLKTDTGRDAVRRLAADADVLLHNYRPGVMDKLGLSSDVLRAANDRLIYLGVSGFGTTGPMAGNAAYDHVIQGLSGLTSMQGRDCEMKFINTLICDKITAYTVAQATTAALLARASTGKGQHIDISMLQASLAFMWPDGMMHKTIEDADGRIDMPPMSDYYQTLDLRDGSVALAPLHDHHWNALLPMLGYPELLEDPRFNSMGGRLMHMDHVMEILRQPRTDHSVAEALEIMTQADIPCAPCVARDDLKTHPQIEAIQALESYETRLHGSLTVARPPVKFEGENPSQAAPSPALGEHSHVILASLGYTHDDIEGLVAAGSVKCG
ncbi:MAG: CoA transferase [Rhizobiales bacterium TMED143]|nr:CoA transferase [Rhodobiaceae bacterium]OUV91651.1 MAG: CoA transferase [Rhizobiales bacterium TMED143]